MALTYATYVTELASIAAVTEDDPNFTGILPGTIDYAEQRIYRELDLLSTIVRDSSSTLTTGNRSFTLPQSLGRFVTVQSVNVITPAGTVPMSGSRTQLQPVSRDYVDAVWGSVSGSGVPAVFAMITDQEIIVGPWPDNTYGVEVIGTIRPTPLSATNTTTFLTNYLSDLFIAASMVFYSGFMRNFGSQSDNPQQAMSWETQYQTLLASAKGEEMRRKFASFDWSSHSVEIGKPK